MSESTTTLSSVLNPAQFLTDPAANNGKGLTSLRITAPAAFLSVNNGGSLVTGTFDTSQFVVVNGTLSIANGVIPDQSAITTETERAEAAEASLAAQITTTNGLIGAETTRASGVENSLSQQITAVGGQAGTNAAAIAAETNRATTAETALGTTLAGNTVAIQAETTRATNVEGNLGGQISNLSGTVTSQGALLNTNITNLTAEAAARAAADTNLQQQITSAGGTLANLTSIVAMQGGEIGAETNRATAAETTIQGNVTTETAARIAADQLLLALSGGQMAGRLLLFADPINPLEAATAQFVLNRLGQLATGTVEIGTPKGFWNATTNTPTLSNNGGGGVLNDAYIVQVAGGTNLDGISNWNVGDIVMSRLSGNSLIWDRLPNVGTLGAFQKVSMPESLEYDDGTPNGVVVWTDGIDNVVMRLDATGLSVVNLTAQTLTLIGALATANINATGTITATGDMAAAGVVTAGGGITAGGTVAAGGDVTASGAVRAQGQLTGAGLAMPAVVLSDDGGATGYAEVETDAIGNIIAARGTDGTVYLPGAVFDQSGTLGLANIAASGGIDVAGALQTTSVVLPGLVEFDDGMSTAWAEIWTNQAGDIIGGVRTNGDMWLPGATFSVSGVVLTNPSFANINTAGTIGSSGDITTAGVLHGQGLALANTYEYDDGLTGQYAAVDMDAIGNITAAKGSDGTYYFPNAVFGPNGVTLTNVTFAGAPPGFDILSVGSTLSLPGNVVFYADGGTTDAYQERDKLDNILGGISNTGTAYGIFRQS